MNHAVTLIGILSVFIALSSYALLQQGGAFNLPSTISGVSPQATVRMSRRFGSVGSKEKENNKLTFDLQADLTPLFNWNTKQIFVYLTAEYPGKSEGSSNKVTYWDKIITSKDNANLTLQNEKSKYSVWDVEDTFRNREATVKLEWDIQPYVGILISGETTGEVDVVFPTPPTGEEARAEKMKRRQQKQH